MKTPKIEKREPRAYDYQEMTWEKFLRLRKWGKEFTKLTGYPAYLVGSALKKTRPRDFDVVVVLPLAVFEEKFGALTEENWSERVAKAFYYFSEHYFNCAEVFGEVGLVPIDFKVYPDTWFTEEDRLPLI